jgi:hypothetical protein
MQKYTSYHVFVIITQWTLIFNNFDKSQTKIDCKIHQILSDTNIKQFITLKETCNNTICTQHKFVGKPLTLKFDNIP